MVGVAPVAAAVVALAVPDASVEPAGVGVGAADEGVTAAEDCDGWAGLL